MTHPPRGRMRRFVRRNRSVLAVAVAVAIASSGTTAAATSFLLATTNTAGATTTLRSSANGAVLQLTNVNSTGGTSARALSLSVPAGRAPITVNATAGKATNLNADKLDGIDSSGFLRGPVEPWRVIGAAGQPAFTPICGAANCFTLWGNYGDSFNTAAFYRDPVGVVHLRGLIKNILFTDEAMIACSWKVFTLPAGYRPGGRTIVPVLSSSGPARIDITPNGEISLCEQTSYLGTWYLLDGISFRADQ